MGVECKRITTENKPCSRFGEGRCACLLDLKINSGYIEKLQKVLRTKTTDELLRIQKGFKEGGGMADCEKSTVIVETIRSVLNNRTL